MKTVKEWSDSFDVLYNSVMSNAAPSLDEYEKSVFLTKAQDEIVKNYFNPKGNKYQEGFDDNAKRQSDFATLIKSQALSAATQVFDTRSSAYSFPPDFFIAINEQYQVTASDNKVYPYTIIPISYTEYARLMQKPYKYPPKSQVWRLIVGETTSGGTTVGYWSKTGQATVVGEKTDAVASTLTNGGTPYTTVAEAEADGWVHTTKTIGGGVSIPVVEIIGRYNPAGTGRYMLRYVRRPNPIILVDLSTIDNNLSINGDTATSACELPEHIHEEILQRAVELAKAAYASDQNGTVQLNNQVQVGQRSE